MGVEIRLDDKNAIVTGGADGIGRETALLLAEAGANVLVADIRKEEAEEVSRRITETYGRRSAAVPCDVSNSADLDHLVDVCLKTFGSIDILAHIAGFSRKIDFLELSEEMYDRIMDVNAKGTFLINQKVLRVMIEQRGGKIVNMSSISGKTGTEANVAYSASKFAVTGMTQALAKYAAPYNVNVNCVCPGFVRTAIWEQLLQDHADAGNDPDALWADRMSKIPLHRPQTTADIARMVVYLSSSFADNMTGQAINITGGTIMH